MRAEITVFFVDDGQDFLEWDLSDKGEVVECRPFQGWLWNGTMVHNKDRTRQIKWQSNPMVETVMGIKDIQPGDYLDVTLPDGTRRTMRHAVEKVQEIA